MTTDKQKSIRLRNKLTGNVFKTTRPQDYFGTSNRTSAGPIYEKVKRRKVTRVKKNPTARIRRPSQTRRRSGFPGYIVTFIRPNAFYHKRQYIGGSKGRWTVVYKRNLAQVFSTSDKAKNVVRNNRKWFELNGIKQVTLLQTNEPIGKFS